MTTRTWRDATGVVLTGLNAALTPPCLPAVPQTLVSEFVVVRRTGGSMNPDQVLDNARIQVEVWKGNQNDPGQSIVPVHTLAEEVREALRRLPETTTAGIEHVREDGMAYFPDPVSNIPRVIITATVVLKPTA